MTTPEIDADLLRQVLDELSGVVYVYDIQQRQNLYINRRWVTDYGYSLEETHAPGDFLASILHPDDLDAAIDHHRQLARTKEPRSLRYRIRRKSGQWAWLESTDRPFSFDADGKVRLIVGSARDITHEIELQQHTTESEARFRAIVEHLPDAVFIGNHSGRFVEVNSSACEQLGYSREELLELGIQDIIAPEFRARARGRLESGTASGYLESMHLRKDGSHVPVEVCVVPIQFEGSFALLGVARDIEERKELESRLRDAQRLEAVGRLAGAIAHDFNNLLSVIVGAGEVLRSDLSLDEDARTTLDDLSRAADRGADLTRQLLMFSRRQPAQMKSLDLGARVRDALRLVRRLLDESVRLETHLATNCFISADGAMIDQVVVNLVVNARDAMPRGGLIRVTVERTGSNAEETTGPAVVLRVEDTGEGIEDHALPHVFEPFFTTKPTGAGTGLGLAAVYGIVKQHGGTVSVESEPGRGATFIVGLPSVPAPGAASESKQRPEAPLKQRILLVDDQDHVRRTIRRLLTKTGHEVVEASSADEALALFDSEDFTVDTLLTDVSLGMGPSGPDLAAAIEKKRPGLRVIFMSGYDSVLDSLPLSAGRDFIQKPFRLAELDAILSQRGAGTST